jgi:hypothetical protein
MIPRIMGVQSALVDKDQACGIRPTLELLPLRAPAGHLRPQLFGGKNAFFKAQSLGMREAPDLHIIDLYAPHRQLGHQPAQGEVASTPLGQPIAQIARQQPGLVPSGLRRGYRPGVPVTLHPLDRTAFRNPEPCRRAARRHALVQNRRKNPLAKVDGISANHAMLASNSSRHRESHSLLLGNPQSSQCNVITV